MLTITVSLILLPLTAIISWDKMAELNNAQHVYDLAMRGDGYLYAGAKISAVNADRGRVFVSNDLWNWQECVGKPWSPPDTIEGVYALINGVDDTLFAGVGLYHSGDVSRVFKSSDGGATWLPLNGYGTFRVGSRVYALFEDNLGYLHLGNNYWGMRTAYPRRSTDRGVNWSLPDTTNSTIYYHAQQYCFCQSSDNLLYFGSWGGDGVHVSTDNGTTWHRSLIAAEISDSYTIVELGSDTILVGTDADIGRLYMTTDQGNSWTELGNGYFDSTTAIRSLFVSSEGYIYAGTSPNAEVFVSVDRGNTWVSTGLLTGATTVYAFAEGMKSTGGADQDSIFLFASTGPNGDVFRGLMYTVGRQEHYSDKKIILNVYTMPNPSRVTTNIHYTIPGISDKARLIIYDSGGRVIRTYSLNNYAGTSSQLIWDNRDTQGNSVAAGIYFIILESRSQQTMVSCVITK